MAAQSSTFNLGLDELSSPDTLRAAFAEFLATGLFVFIGVGCIAAFVITAGPNSAIIDALPVIAFGHGLAIAVLAAGIGAISGGHINPAVTFAMVLTGRITVARGAVYVVAQLAGAVAGMALLRGLVIDEVILAIPGAGGHAINTTIVNETLYAVALEAIGTFVLVWTIFSVAVSRRGNAGTLAPLYIGLTVGILHFLLVPLTGSGLNPARTFGPALFNNRWNDQMTGEFIHWVYWVGPLIGAAVAGMTYYVLFLIQEEPEPQEPLG